jgi:hypothetical protein
MLSEHDVDRELKAALAASPSPGFEARVLQRIEADRRSRRSAYYGWLAAAASLIIAAGVLYAMTRTSPPPAQLVQQAPPTPAPHPAAPLRTATIERPRVERARVVRTAAQTAPRRAEPEVLVPVNQMEAVWRLVHAVNEGRVQVPADPPSGPMPPLPQVNVSPFVLEPIPLTPLAGAGGQ